VNTRKTAPIIFLLVLILILTLNTYSAPLKGFSREYSFSKAKTYEVFRIKGLNYTIILEMTVNIEGSLGVGGVFYLAVGESNIRGHIYTKPAPAKTSIKYTLKITYREETREYTLAQRQFTAYTPGVGTLEETFSSISITEITGLQLPATIDLTVSLKLDTQLTLTATEPGKQKTVVFSERTFTKLYETTATQPEYWIHFTTLKLQTKILLDTTITLKSTILNIPLTHQIYTKQYTLNLLEEKIDSKMTFKVKPWIQIKTTKKTYTTQEEIQVTGKTTPPLDYKITVVIEQLGKGTIKKQEITAKNGQFTYKTKLPEGHYIIWAETNNMKNYTEITVVYKEQKQPNIYLVAGISITIIAIVAAILLWRKRLLLKIIYLKKP